MNVFKSILLAATLSISATAGAQSSYHVPEDVTLKSDTDYLRYKQDIIDAAEYLKQLPLGKEADNRKAVSAFILQWAAGSPDVTIMLKEQVTGAFMKEGDMLILYTAAWASHVLKTSDTSSVNGNLAGARAVLDFYRNPANKAARSKKLDVWVRKDEAGTFDAYMKELWAKQ